MSRGFASDSNRTHMFDVIQITHLMSTRLFGALRYGFLVCMNLWQTNENTNIDLPMLIECEIVQVCMPRDAGGPLLRICHATSNSIPLRRQRNQLDKPQKHGRTFTIMWSN
jgi:hypothetical protein